jgi:hypothetical protein
MLSTWQTLHAKPMQVVIAGTRGAEDTASLVRVADRHLPPNSQFFLADGGENQRFLSEQLPFMENIGTMGGKATAYVCVNVTCSLPVNSPQGLEQLLREQKKANVRE